MAKKKQPVANGFVLFDVFYQDGSRTSNRKVPASEVGTLDGDAPIARLHRGAGPHRSPSARGTRAVPIKTIARSAA